MTERDRGDIEGQGRASLPDFDRRLSEALVRQRGRKGASGGPSRGGDRGMAAGMRIAVELLAAVLVGTGIGILLDRWWGTQPWLLIAFFVLGSAAGFLNVIRTAKELDRQRREERTAAAKTPPKS